jgi:hypothetical protein
MIVFEALTDIETSEDGETVIKLTKSFLDAIGFQTTSEFYVYSAEKEPIARQQIYLSTLPLSSGLGFSRVLIRSYRGSLSELTDKIEKLDLSIERFVGFTTLKDEGIAEIVIKVPFEKAKFTKLPELDAVLKNLAPKCIITHSVPEPISSIVSEVVYQHFHGKIEVEPEADYAKLVFSQNVSRELGLCADNQLIGVASAYARIPLITIGFFRRNELYYVECYVKEEAGSLNELLQKLKKSIDISFISLSGVREGKYFTRIWGVPRSSQDLDASIRRCDHRIIKDSVRTGLVETKLRWPTGKK